MGILAFRKFVGFGPFGFLFPAAKRSATGAVAAAGRAAVGSTAVAAIAYAGVPGSVAGAAVAHGTVGVDIVTVVLAAVCLGAPHILSAVVRAVAVVGGLALACVATVGDAFVAASKVPIVAIAAAAVYVRVVEPAPFGFVVGAAAESASAVASVLSVVLAHDVGSHAGIVVETVVTVPLALALGPEA
ncbi:hypothetical protein CBR_g53821 [Chara braunii]|uniref:Uncharacterized protein n=1 Tax=Chara braunii TaxID=69332 RepID=A0A388K749_CHABU|nr:hypothetical protein CBR_g53821 [Chara braunii]|eukprot:GBG65849.1 hypothetical protein CBR_g53821 [Chara braunii]